MVVHANMVRWWFQKSKAGVALVAFVVGRSVVSFQRCDISTDRVFLHMCYLSPLSRRLMRL